MEECGHASCQGSEWGIGVGVGDAVGARDRNACIWKRDRASAIQFCTPGTCLADTVKLSLGATKNRLRRRAIIGLECEVPVRMQETTAWLSLKKRIFFADQRLPHTSAARTMG